MKKITTLLIIFNLFSCGKGLTLSENSTPSSTEIITAKMQGEYQGCIPSALYGGYYSFVTIRTSGSHFEFIYTLSSSATCATYLNRQNHTYEIEHAEYVPGSSEEIKLDLKVKSVATTFNHSYYIGQNYCGYTDWALGVEKVLTGVSCANLLSTYDSFHTSFRALDTIEYIKVNLRSASFVIPSGFAQSGDSDAERKTNAPLEVPKL